jgi:hypothetical protein
MKIMSNHKQYKMSRFLAKVYAVVAFFCIVAFSSCEDTDYMTYDTSNNGIYFLSDTMQYSFSVTPIEQRTHLVKIPVRVMGGISDVARPINFEVITDTTTAEEGVQYRIGEAVVLPDSINGFIPVEILRDGLKGSNAEGYERYRLGLRLLSNDYFIPTLNVLNQKFVLNFDNSVEQPNWLSADGEKVWIERELGKWHPLKLIKMVEYFHALEEILPETYEKMVVAYGENLEHIPFGDPNLYRTIFRKYIYYPMYEYFSDPANREMILAEFPDFPFDFPNPFA